ncbi:MAG: hypothetical protein DLM57_15110 [Pseudonocardiales bacterium]|nr:MAG: hypothetical protein DLM57_15110 [Pseudonocardiales bacterium]
MAAIGPVLVTGQQRRALTKLLAVAGAPLAFMARVGDARLVPLADPNRPSSLGVLTPALGRLR